MISSLKAGCKSLIEIKNFLQKFFIQFFQYLLHMKILYKKL